VIEYGISTSADASLSRRVMSSSAWLGSGESDGWEWASTKAAT